MVPNFFRLAFLQIYFGRVGHISGPSGPGRSSLPAVFVHFEGSTMVVKFPQTVGQHPRQEVDIGQTRDVSSTHRPRPRACGRLRVLRDARTRWHSILSHQSRGTRTVVTAPIPSAPEPTLSLLTQCHPVLLPTACTVAPISGNLSWQGRRARLCCRYVSPSLLASIIVVLLDPPRSSFWVSFRSLDMSHFVRASKYRHVYVQPPKTGEAYSNIRLSTAVGEQNYIKANPKYFAVALSVSAFISHK